MELVLVFLFAIFTCWVARYGVEEQEFHKIQDFVEVFERNFTYVSKGFPIYYANKNVAFGYTNITLEGRLWGAQNLLDFETNWLQVTFSENQSDVFWLL